MPFSTLVRDGQTPSSIPADNIFHHSFVVANYAADGGCLDNDGPFDLAGALFYSAHDFLTPPPPLQPRVVQTDPPGTTCVFKRNKEPALPPPPLPPPHPPPS
jgi:hypothetical protein